MNVQTGAAEKVPVTKVQVIELEDGVQLPLIQSPVSLETTPPLETDAPIILITPLLGLTTLLTKLGAGNDWSIWKIDHSIALLPPKAPIATVPDPIFD
jgi:hypothetical protein